MRFFQKVLSSLLSASLLGVSMVGAFPVTAADTALSLDEALLTPPTVSGSTLVFPSVPGYTLSLYGSANQQVIGLDGRVTTPLCDMTVELIYQATAEDGSVVTGTKNVAVTVPGKYAVSENDNPKPDVLPALREWKGQTGSFSLTDTSRILYAEASAKAAAETMGEYIAAVTGKTLSVAEGSTGTTGDILLNLAADAVLGQEGYTVSISDCVEVSAYDARALVYAGATLAQIFSQTGLTLPKGQIRDYPAYEVRGIMLDIARTWFPLEEVERFGKYMAYYKLNTLHLHLNEQKIRVENETLPSFTADAAHSYTKEEYGSFLDRLSSYGINVISEVDTPAHATGFQGILPMYDSHQLDIVDEDNRAECLATIGRIIDEYTLGTEKNAPLARSGVMHIGGDEYYWIKGSEQESSTAYKAYMTSLMNRVTDAGCEAYFWMNLDQFNSRAQDPLCGYYSVEERKAIKNPEMVTAYVWDNGMGNVFSALEQGFNVINSEYRRLYITPFSSMSPQQFINHKEYFETWDVTDFRDGKTLPKGHPRNKGAIGCLWNDTAGRGATYTDLFYRVAGLAQMLSEKCWYGSRTPDQTTENYLHRVKTLGVQSPVANPLYHVESDTHTVASLPFDTDGKDTSGNGYDAMLHETASVSNGALQLDGTGYFSLPFEQIGFPWTVSFDLTLDEASVGASLFEGTLGKLFIGTDGKLCYTRNNAVYDGVFSFDYALPVGEKVHITLVGEENIEGESKEKCLKTYLVIDDKTLYEPPIPPA